ncbi:MAG: DNA repair protein RecN, partial [Clostridia bacterium]|nr:DNA repair protein RecN [Clostridia bacterium]
KYGDSEEKVIAYRDKIATEVEELSNYSFMLDKLTNDYTIALENLEQKGIDLSDVRKTYAKQLEVLVVSELKELGMPNTNFAVDIGTYNDIETIANKATNEGIDVVEFLISPNLGEPLKPLGKIISGGEMSRFMLAIKKITAQIDGVNVMVFDEIDTGISGKIAGVVANKLYDISINKQVLAVTHLPQLASMADAHYLIQKTTSNDRTNTNITLLNSEQSAVEIAKMIDGLEASEFAVLHASKLIEIAKEYKGK